MAVIEMCRWYGYDIRKRKPTCDKGQRASLKCHSERSDCPYYFPTGEAAKSKDLYQKFIKGE